MTADAHDHPDFLQHHWDTPKQQFEAGKLGMWLFLATQYDVISPTGEVLFFVGGYFDSDSIGSTNGPFCSWRPS